MDIEFEREIKNRIESLVDKIGTIVDEMHKEKLLRIKNEFSEYIQNYKKTNYIRPVTSAIRHYNKAEIAFYEVVAGKVRSAPLYSWEHNAEGGRDKIKQEPLLSQKELVAHLDALKRKKDGIEERLAESNIKTLVDFDQSIITGLL